MTQQNANHQNKNTTPDDLYAAVVANVLAKVSGPGVSEVTAKELADGIASECVAECGRMGLFNHSQPTQHVQLAVQPEASGAAKPEVGGNGFGAPSFADTSMPSYGVTPTTAPVGAPGAPALHYNHPAVQPQPQPQSYPQVGPGPLPPTQGAPPSQVIGALQPVSQSPTVHPSYVTAPNGGSQPQVAQESRVVFQPDVVESDVPWYPPHLAYMHKKPVPPPQVQAPQPTQVPQVPGTPEPAQAVPSMASSTSMAPPPEVGGQKIVNATGDAYMPPAPAGVMNTVVHLPTPQGHSALGLSGVISQPEVKSSQYERVVAPQNERVITPIGTGGTQFVPENIVK